MSVVILILAPAMRLPPDHPAMAHCNRFLVSYDPKHPDEMVTTDKESEALVFPSAKEALELWRSADGFRPDGKPNRPLTAYSVTVTPTNREEM